MVWNLVFEVIETVSSSESTCLAECIVAWQSVVSSSLDVEGDEVHANAVGRVLGEKGGGDLLGEERVHALALRLAHAADQRVDAAALRVIQGLGTEEQLRNNKIKNIWIDK